MTIVLGALFIFALGGVLLSGFLLLAMAADMQRTGKYW